MASPGDVLTKAITTKSMDANALILEKSRGTMAGSIIGGGVGLLYAFTAKKSLLIFGMIGILVGGMISNIVIGKEIKKPVTAPIKPVDDEEE